MSDSPETQELEPTEGGHPGAEVDAPEPLADDEYALAALSADLTMPELQSDGGA